MGIRQLGKVISRACALIVVIASLFEGTHPASAATIVRYAKPAGLSTGTCTTWAAACTLTHALTVAVSGNEVWAAKGTHKPTTDTNRNVSFELKNGVAVYGGFAGTETLRSQRNWTTNATVLSGDIGLIGNASDNSYHVVVGSGTDGTAMLDGFTLTKGNANGVEFPIYFGGGVYNNSGSPTLSNLTITGNSAADGGGMYTTGGMPTIINVTFSANVAVSGSGGGIMNLYSNPVLTGVTFSGNTAGDSGGGMYNFGSNPTLTDVTFSGNSATNGGGGLNNANSSNLSLTNVTFSGNSANSGGGLNNDATSGPTLTNVIIANSTNGGDCVGSASGTSSYNLIEDSANACGLSDDSNGNIVGSDPKLGSLQNNGGWIQTMALDAGSPAIDTGSPTTCPAADQRGVARPVDGNGDGVATCDIGAVEAVPPPILYAKPNSASNGWCESWAHACEVDYALRLAIPGEQIWAAAGTYTLWDDSNRAASFVLKNGVAVYGGFTGTETLLSQRNPQAHITILSGDVDRVPGPEGNLYHVVVGSGTDSTAILDGFTITGGYANALVSPGDYGGGMYNSGGSPTLTNLVFSGNSADLAGGGMYNDNGSPHLTNVAFTDNGALGNGGGMYNYNSGPALTNVTFRGNTAYGGGGLWNSASSPALTNVTFSGNGANEAGGMHNDNSSPTLTNVTFSGNTAGTTGGMLNASGSSPTLVNVIIADSAYGDDCFGPLNAASTNNLIEGAGNACGLINGVNGNIVGADPRLGPLQNNGGSMQTVALLPGSPAINAGTNAGCPATDQRGVHRPQGPACDIGAYEAPASLSISSIAAQDGWLLESGEKTGVGGLISGNGLTLLVGDDTAMRQYRSLLSFNTGAALPDSAVIVSATLKLTRQSIVPPGSNPFSTLQGLMLDMRRGYFGTAAMLAAADFQAAPDKTFGAYKPIPSGAVYSINLPASALPYINKLASAGGLTQVRLRFALDDNNNSVANIISFYSGNHATLKARPTLVISYYVP